MCSQQIIKLEGLVASVHWHKMEAFCCVNHHREKRMYCIHLFNGFLNSSCCAGTATPLSGNRKQPPVSELHQAARMFCRLSASLQDK